MTRISVEGLIENTIQDFRLAKKLTQQELADAVKVTRATIVALEKGSYNPSLELAFRISKFFGVGIEELFRFKSNTKKG